MRVKLSKVTSPLSKLVSLFYYSASERVSLFYFASERQGERISYNDPLSSL